MSTTQRVFAAQCYKHVCALVEKQMGKAPKKHRKNVLYVMSSICRQSRSSLGAKDKYGESSAAHRPAAKGMQGLAAPKGARRGLMKVLACGMAGARFELSLQKCAELLGEAPEDLVRSCLAAGHVMLLNRLMKAARRGNACNALQGQVQKVVGSWQREGIFSRDALSNFQVGPCCRHKLFPGVLH
jgi:hypothetical protein